MCRDFFWIDFCRLVTMKNSFSLLFVLFFLANISLAEKKDAIPFPTFRILKMDSTSYITQKDLKENKNTVFINFSPTCDHCQRTVKSIVDNIAKFKETQFVLTSYEDFSTIRKFYFDYFLSSFSNIYIGQDKDNTLTKQIQFSSFPSIVMFNKNKKWIKKIDGETNAKVLLKALKIK
ncbi:MAG: redoxin [Bacteroidota bacterium]|nr:redoxin [Bacteroidota bacterium]